jgi:hypothetical protein
MITLSVYSKLRTQPTMPIVCNPIASMDGLPETPGSPPPDSASDGADCAFPAEDFAESPSSLLSLLHATDPEIVAGIADLYSTRRDLPALKARLLELARNPDCYWRHFRAFLGGTVDRAAFTRALQRYLPSEEARQLHNELVRAVLHNAHFSTLPPPAIALPPAALPRAGAPPAPPFASALSHGLPPLCAADLRRLPTAAELASRMRLLGPAPQMAPPGDESARMVCAAAHAFVARLLARALTAEPGPGQPRRPGVALAQLVAVLRSDAALGRIPSEVLFHKYRFM